MKLLLCPLFAAAAVLALVSDSPAAELSNLTATAILGWYAWHTATQTIPQLVDSFRCELATERTQQRADRDTFLHEMAEERLQRHADNLAVVQAVDQLSTLVARTSAAQRKTNSAPAIISLPIGEKP